MGCLEDEVPLALIFFFLFQECAFVKDMGLTIVDYF